MSVPCPAFCFSKEVAFGLAQGRCACALPSTADTFWQRSAALAVVAPVWNVIYSLGLLTGIGGSVLLSAKRGSGAARQAEANAYFTTAVLASVLLAVNIFSTYYFQAILKPGAAFFVSVARGLVISGARRGRCRRAKTGPVCIHSCYWG